MAGRIAAVAGLAEGRPGQPQDGGDQMNEKNDDLTHPGMLSNLKKHLILPQIAIRHAQVWPERA